MTDTPPRPRPDDQRFTYGAVCTWRGPIQEVAARPGTGLPCCPHCGGPLYETESAEKWHSDIATFETNGHPGYAAFQQWLADQPRCLPYGNVERANALLDRYVADGNTEPPGLRL